MAVSTPTVQPTANTPNWRPGAIWQWLTEPVQAIKQPEQRRRARLLSALLVVLTPLGIVSLALVSFSGPGYRPLQDPFFFVAVTIVVVFAVAYALSRTANYMSAAILTVAVLPPMTLVAVYFIPTGIDSLLVYITLDVLLASMLLPVQGTLIVGAANIVLLLLLPVISPDISFNALTPPLSFNVIMSSLILLAASIRHQDLQQIEKQTADLSEAVRQAEIANKLKDHFLANMSHELRTPLNAIIGFTEVTLMGLTGEITAETRRASERIHHNSERLLQLIDDILDISKIEAGRVEILNQPFSPAEMLSSVELSLKPQATNKGLVFATELDPKLPPKLIGDAKRLEQILINLTSNAVKFTEKGSVTVVLKRLSTEEWAILVSDTGIGIPPHSLETIFEKFRQVDGSSRRAYGGSGLGLAIVRELALLMNGSVKVKSPPGAGSTFTVTLPLISEEGVKS